MAQQEQQEFEARLQEAFSWMQAVQEELRANDNTAGPRDALEARLKETEVWRVFFDGVMLSDFFPEDLVGNDKVVICETQHVISV